MRDIRKSPNNLSQAIYNGLAIGEQAVLPELQRLITDQNVDGVLAPIIADAWEFREVGSVPGALRTILSLQPMDLAHKDPWKFPLRVVQCAALNDRAMRAQLVSDPSLSGDARRAAIENIRGIGRQATGFLAEVIDVETLARPSSGSEWSDDASKKVEKLCLKRSAFAVSMTSFVDVVTAIQDDSSWENKVPHTLQGLFRLQSLAAIVGQDLQIEFVEADTSPDDSEPAKA